MSLYSDSRTEADFDAGIRTAIQAIIAKPEFVFRFERVPAGVAPGKAYRISDLELASRLSYFFWSSVPDEQLINVASQGKLKDPAVLEREVKRMLADPRSRSSGDQLRRAVAAAAGRSGHSSRADDFPRLHQEPGAVDAA